MSNVPSMQIRYVKHVLVTNRVRYQKLAYLSRKSQDRQINKLDDI